MVTQMPNPMFELDHMNISSNLGTRDSGETS